MTRANKIVGISIASALLLGGFAFGRLSETPKTTAAEENKAALSQPAPSPLAAAKDDQQFYLSDFKTGYTDGYNAGLSSESTSVVATQRTGYNDGYKEGYTDGYQARVNPQQTVVTSVARPTRVVQRDREVVYRSAPAPARRKRSTLNTVLTIAAPAAVGAGVGGAIGGGKGAGVGALIGGGGGALYTLIKNRDQ
jgi:hypothetical protein